MAKYTTILGKKFGTQRANFGPAIRGQKSTGVGKVTVRKKHET
jgi:hypothetical protein